MSKWGLNGAPMHLSCLSLDPSSRRSGTLTLLMPPTSLCYGQEYCHGRYIDSPFAVVVIMIYIINTHGVIRLAGALTPALQRKYFTMIYMTVSTMTLYQVHHMPNAHLITLSHAVTRTSRTPRTSQPHSILFLASSNRQSSSNLFNYLLSALTRTHPFFVQAGRREAPHVGLQIFA